jgi:RimJ/RimL family protein N-acetyltransferase
MDSGAIRTHRLTLRLLRPEDAEPIARMIAEWEVIRWLTTPPYPYRLADAVGFISRAGPEHRAITRDGALIGVVTLGDDLGYWLGLPFHGQGFMTEAAGAMLARHFAAGGCPVTSGHLLGNDPSRRVLLKLGFRDSHVSRSHSNSHGREVDVQRMERAR